MFKHQIVDYFCLVQKNNEKGLKGHFFPNLGALMPLEAAQFALKLCYSKVTNLKGLQI